MTIDCSHPIAATPAAQQAIQRLRAEHGDIMLHVTGGCCDARTPLCLKVGELNLGKRDILLGIVDGIPIYETQTTPEVRCCDGSYIIDVVRGVPVGFSIAPADGMRFAIRPTVARPTDPKIPSSVEVVQECREEAYA